MSNKRVNQPGGAAQLPAAALSGEPGEFSAYLESAGLAFLVVRHVPPHEAHIRFTGPFEGREVVWDCRFVTLESEWLRVKASSDAAAVQCLRSFIDIGEPQRHGVPLQVGLNLSRIDVPSMQKMILMIRNYKRLRSGRHEFGAQWKPRPEPL